MVRPLVAAALAAVALGGCGSGADAGLGGRLRVERVTSPSATILDEPARARYCADDSLLTVIAIGRNWVGGLALRGVLPPAHQDTFQIGPTLKGLGTATAAFRAIGGAARLGTSGRLLLRAGTVLDGEFQLTAGDTAGAPLVYRGRLNGIPVLPAAKGACRQ